MLEFKYRCVYPVQKIIHLKGNEYLVEVKGQIITAILSEPLGHPPTIITHDFSVDHTGKGQLVLSSVCRMISKFDYYNKAGLIDLQPGDRIHLHSKNGMYTIKELRGHKILLCTKRIRNTLFGC